MGWAFRSDPYRFYLSVCKGLESRARLPANWVSHITIFTLLFTKEFRSTLSRALFVRSIGLRGFRTRRGLLSLLPFILF